MITLEDLAPLANATDRAAFFVSDLPTSKDAKVALCRKKLVSGLRFLRGCSGRAYGVELHQMQRKLSLLTSSIKHNTLEHEARLAKLRNLLHGFREAALSKKINQRVRADLGLAAQQPGVNQARAAAAPQNQALVYHHARRQALQEADLDNAKYQVPTKVYSTASGAMVPSSVKRLPFTRSAANEEAIERRNRHLCDSSAMAVQRFVKEVAPNAAEVTFRPPEGAFTGSKHLPLPTHMRGISDSFSRPRRRLGLTRAGDRLLFSVKTAKPVTNTYAVPTRILPNNTTLKINNTSVTKFIVQTLKIQSNDNTMLEFKTATKVVLTPQEVSAITSESASGASTSSSSTAWVKSVGDLPTMALAGISRAAGVKPKNDEQV
jgi:hypothetical protein